MDKKGSKFNYDSYSFKNDHAKPFIQTISQRNCKRICVCNNYNENKCFQCFKCKEKIHNCTKVQINRPQIHSFQCMSCLARSMDLIYQPQTILLETFFKTENIFEKSNCINFQFNLKFEETKFPVDVRCFKGSKIELVWPMQGQFYLNGSKVPTFGLKPLKSNSNRKNRKQDNFLIQPELLKEGLNTLTFKIPRLQKGKFIDAFQYEETGIYYLALYSVKELTNQQVLNITQRQRRHEKASTLALFHLGDQELPTQKQKIRLIDPYTCERIKFPVRGRYCKHVSTICLLTYISFQKCSRSWKCPICAVQVGNFLNEPYLDVWMYEILKEKDKGDSVIVYANGMYEWENVEKKVMSLDDSNDSDEELRSTEQNMHVEKIFEQEPLVLALQNIELESQSQQQQLEQISSQVNLCEYDYVIDYDQNQNDPLHEQLMKNASMRNDSNIEVEIFQTERQEMESQLQSQGEMSDGLKEKLMGMGMMEDDGQFYCQHYPHVSDVLIDDDEHLNEDSHLSSSNSELQELAAQNKFIPPSIISNIIPTKQALIQQKSQQKTPQIYSSPLQPKQRTPNPNKFIIQGRKIIQQQLSKLKTHQQTIINKPNENVNKISIPNKFPLPNAQKPITKIQIKNQFINENKRLLERPTFAQQLENVKKQKSLSLPNNQRYQTINFGKMSRKNIEISQSIPFRTNQSMPFKSEPKTEYNTPFDQNSILPLPKQLKKQENEQEKPKQIKIKTMKFDLISHSKFIKHYCNIPIPTLTRKLNQDMKRLFRNILEVN